MKILNWFSHAWRSDKEANLMLEQYNLSEATKTELLEEHRNKQNLQVKLKVLSLLMMTREAFHSFFKMFAPKNQSLGITV